MDVSATVFEILTLKARKSLNFPTSPFFECPFGWNPLEFVMKFGVRKLESWGYQMWRNHDASFLRFDTIPARNRRRDGQTERQTDRHIAILLPAL